MKKIIAFILMIVLGVQVVAFAEPSDEQLRDLKKYSIMVGDENGNMRLEDSITRAEATKMVCTILGIGVDSFAKNVEPSKFSDVPDSHWAKNYINVMKEYAIVIGDENGNFNPEADVTNEEIIKMLVTALGYAPMADTMGGFPMGYTATAQRIGVSAGLKLEVEAPAIRGDVAQMFAAALDIPIMVQDSWSPDGATYTILDGSAGTKRETLRTMYFENGQMAVLRLEEQD